ncbi:MAG: YbbR-like domain-containing protein [Bacteroidales bacterium]
MIISIMFWILQSLNDKEEIAVDIPLSYINVPRNIILTNDPPQSVSVVIADKGINLINYTFWRATPIKIDFENYQRHNGKIVISRSQLLSAVHDEMKSSSELIAMHLDSVVIMYAERKGYMINVKLNSNISAAPNFIQTSHAIITPNKVKIFANKDVVSSLGYIETKHLTLSDLKDTTVVTVHLKHIKGAKIVPETVTVTIPVEELIAKKITLPIYSMNFPEGISVITFPANVNLEFMVPLSRFPCADTSKFRVTVDYLQLNKKHTNKLLLNISRFPEYVRRMDLEPDSVEYILEADL